MREVVTHGDFPVLRDLYHGYITKGRCFLWWGCGRHGFLISLLVESWER